jgi:hypothetical protein
MAAKRDNNKNLREVKDALQRLQRIGNDLSSDAAASENPGRAVASLENLVNRKDGSRAIERVRSRAGNRSGDAKSFADKRRVQGRRLGALALAMIAAGAVIVLASDLFLKYWPTSASSKQGAAVNGKVTSSAAAIERAGPKISDSHLPIDARQSVKQPDAEHGQVALQADGVPALSANPAFGSARQLMDGGHIAAAREMLLQPHLATSQEGAWLLARSYDPNYLVTIQSPDAPADKEQAEEWYRRWRDIGVRSGMVMDDLRLKRIIESMQ